ncbi:MAG TPA: hypothetical protein VNF51_00020 [Candidatus Paceibacterota bacterium]|nr:hypothetical protein [Candidatus Paceibacterota bacterium]
MLGTLALLIGFLILTWYEEVHGARLFAPFRSRFDRDVGRIQFVLTHADFWAFLRDEMRHGARRIAHDIAHISLQAVRAVEHLLTRLVRHFRTRQVSTAAPRESARAFVKTLSEFKGGLEATRPEIPDIP